MRNHAFAQVASTIAIVVGTSVAARAQTDAVPAPLPAFRTPLFSASAGVGTADSHAGRPLATVSTEFFLARQFLVQAEFAGSADAALGAVNLLFATDPRRVRALIGAGFGSITMNDFDHRDSAGFVQFVSSVDVHVAGPLHAFASFGLGTEDSTLRVSTGVRVVALTRSAIADTKLPFGETLRSQASPAAAIGKPVRVTLANGARFSGRLVSFTDSGLAVRSTLRDFRYPLSDVRIVERTSYAAPKGAAIGGAAGFVVGCILGGDGGDIECPGGGLIIGGVGAGIGAVVGGAIASAQRAAHLLYLGPGPRVTVLPIVTPHGGHVAVSIQLKP